MLTNAVGSNCENLWVGYAYCVSGPPSSTSVSGTPAPSAAPIRSGTASGCTKYYTVQSSDSCQKIESLFGLTFAMLYKWNTDIGSDCQALWSGYSICVAGGP
jgi:hypothetical protein